ncbi:MAG: hypothetical protein PHC50_03460 [Candidatus Cloacimonetes bacterium]|nr:hypothetical protein [Candidatus Cloacimonadota bacterium]
MDTIKKMMQEYKYLNSPFYTATMSLNIFGIRHSRMLADEFDDTIGVIWKANDKLNVLTFPATTDPGAYYLKSPMNPNGTAILVPGHYPGLWRLGLHRGHPALVQRGKCSIYRDNNQDDRLDLDAQSITTGLFGINLHRAQASGKTQKIGKYSAGCQVLQYAQDMDTIIDLLRLQQKYLGTDAVSYTLFYAPEMLCKGEL